MACNIVCNALGMPIKSSVHGNLGLHLMYIPLATLCLESNLHSVFVHGTAKAQAVQRLRIIVQQEKAMSSELLPSNAAVAVVAMPLPLIPDAIGWPLLKAGILKEGT